MFGISAAEFAVIALIALLVVGPQQMPQVLRTAGRMYRKLNHFIKSASQVIDDTLYDADRIAARAEKALTEKTAEKQEGNTDDE